MQALLAKGRKWLSPRLKSTTKVSRSTARVTTSTKSMCSSRFDGFDTPAKPIEEAPVAAPAPSSAPAQNFSQELDEANARIRELESQLEEKQADGNAIAQALIIAQRSADEILAKANNTAAETIQDAKDEAQRIMSEFEKECGWMYETHHVAENGDDITGLDGKAICGRINYTVWSDVFVCPSCSRDFVFSDVALVGKKVLDVFQCPYCHSKLKKQDCDHAYTTVYDALLGQTIQTIRQAPILINYSVGKSKYESVRPDHLSGIRC